MADIRDWHLARNTRRLLPLSARTWPPTGAARSAGPLRRANVLEPRGSTRAALRCVRRSGDLSGSRLWGKCDLRVGDLGLVRSAGIPSHKGWSRSSSSGFGKYPLGIEALQLGLGRPNRASSMDRLPRSVAHKRETPEMAVGARGLGSRRRRILRNASRRTLLVAGQLRRDDKGVEDSGFDAIRGIYAAIDDAIGKLRAELPSDTALHGGEWRWGSAESCWVASAAHSARAPGLHECWRGSEDRCCGQAAIPDRAA